MRESPYTESKPDMRLFIDKNIKGWVMEVRAEHDLRGDEVQNKHKREELSALQTNSVPACEFLLLSKCAAPQ